MVEKVTGNVGGETGGIDTVLGIKLRFDFRETLFSALTDKGKFNEFR